MTCMGLWRAFVACGRAHATPSCVSAGKGVSGGGRRLACERRPQVHRHYDIRPRAGIHLCSLCIRGYQGYLPDMRNGTLRENGIKKGRLASKQASKQKQCDQCVRLGSPRRAVLGGQNSKSRRYINVSVPRFAVVPLQARGFGYVDAGRPGAVRRQSLAPLESRNRDEVRQGIGTLGQGQLSCRHGDSSGGLPEGRGERARGQNSNIKTAASEVEAEVGLSLMGNRRLGRLRATKGRPASLELGGKSQESKAQTSPGVTWPSLQAARGRGREFERVRLCACVVGAEEGGSR